MKLVFIIFAVVIALATAASIQDDNVRRSRLTALELKDTVTDNIRTIPIQGRTAILSANGKDMVENFINKLPCGWPEAGIPPLAPYAKKEIDFEFKKSFVDLSQKLEYFRMDGLDIVLIEKLKVGYIFGKSVKFDLIFPRITLSGKYLTNILIDFMKDYGISVEYDGKGDFELMLEYLNFQGSFKYDMPFVFGNTKIYKFHLTMTMGNFVSKIGGIGGGGNGKLNRLLNDKIEEIVLHIFNSKQYEISEKLEEILVPFINGKLENRNMWTFFKSLFGKKGKICYPPPYPW